MIGRFRKRPFLLPPIYSSWFLYREVEKDASEATQQTLVACIRAAIPPGPGAKGKSKRCGGWTYPSLI